MAIMYRETRMLKNKIGKNKQIKRISIRMKVRITPLVKMKVRVSIGLRDSNKGKNEYEEV